MMTVKGQRYQHWHLHNANPQYSFDKCLRETSVSTSCISAADFQIGGAWLRPTKWVQWDFQGQRRIQSVKLYEQKALIMPKTVGTLNTNLQSGWYERKSDMERTTERRNMRSVYSRKRNQSGFGMHGFFERQSQPMSQITFPYSPSVSLNVSSLAFSLMHTICENGFIESKQQQQKKKSCLGKSNSI